MGHHGRCALRVALLVAVSATALPASAVAAPTPLGRSCTDQNGVRFCPGSSGNRVTSADGIAQLLDVDVTLPPGEGDGPFPTIVMLHGYGGNKTNFEQTKAEGDKQPSEATSSATLYNWNNVHFAKRGYAVVNYSARGFGDSCGMETERVPCTLKKGWIRLADQRFEARDTQHLLGLLVDEGISDPGALGVTGISYGGGQSIELAYLKNRVRNPDDTFSPWVSPGPNATPLSIAAAFPRWPWSDLVDALLPNGRFLDNRVASETESREPLGISLQSFTAGLFASGEATGFYAPLGLDPDADLIRWNTRVQAGEPPDAEARAIADEIYAHHQGYGLPAPAGGPAPLLLQSGWTDDLFPAKQSLRLYNALRAANPDAPVSLQLADLGHQRGSNKVNADKLLNDQGTSFFDARLRGQGSAPAAGSVTTFTQTCPQGAPAGGPFQAASWDAIHPGAVRFGSGAAQTFTSAGASPATAAGVDPVGGGGDACRDFSGETEPNTAVYEVASEGFTLMGLPAVTATVETTGPFGEIASRLWDVRPDGRKVLVSRGIYRLDDDQKGRVTFQLFGNGYRFEAGHRVRLELLGRDAPTFRASNGTFSVKVSDLQVNLPVLEQPGTTSQIGTPVPVGATGRRKPRLSAKLRMSRRRVLSTRGRLILPQGVARTSGCRGRVTVQVKAGRRTISTRRAFVRRPGCTFASKVRFRSARRFRGAKRLRVTVRYGGNAVLTPAALKSRRVKVRGR